MRNFLLMMGVMVVLVGCVSNPQQLSAEEKQVREERCYSTGSNLARRDCSDTKAVSRKELERSGAVAPPSNTGAATGAQ